jgi:hypothetical protein
LALAILSSALGCAGSAERGPYFGDERFLTLGVDPESEAKVVVKDLAASGHSLSVRTRGRSFVALGFEAQGAPAHVRIVTGRGIALALDAWQSHALDVGVRYTLLVPPEERAPDVDGDGNEEVFVAVAPYDGGEACLAAYRVHAAGNVTRVASNLGATVPGQATWSRLLPCAVGSQDQASQDQDDSDQDNPDQAGGQAPEGEQPAKDAQGNKAGDKVEPSIEEPEAGAPADPAAVDRSSATP